MITRSVHKVTVAIRITVAICLVFAAGVALAPSAWSAGLMLYEQGTPDVGLASAGQGARRSSRIRNCSSGPNRSLAI